MTERIDIKIILISSLFATVLSLFVLPLLHTFLNIFTDMELDRPIGAYLLWGYFPLSLAGLYVGYSAKKNILINGVVVGIVYSLGHDLYSIILIRNSWNINWMSMIYGLVKYAIFCGLISLATFKIINFLKKKDNAKSNP